MAQKPHSIASDAFRELYDTLYGAIAQPNLTHRLAARLYQRLLITWETRDAVHHTLGISPGQQAALLLQAVEASIHMDHRRFRYFVRVLKREPILKPVAEALCQRYSTLVSEAGQSESSNDSESEPEDGLQLLPSHREADSRFEGTLTGRPTTQPDSQDQMKPTVGQPTALNPVPSSPPNVATSTQSLQVIQPPLQPVSIPPAPLQQQPPSGNTAIETYAFYLKFDVYLRKKFPTYGKWPPNPTKKYINLALIKKQKMSKEEMDHFMKQTIRGDINDILKEKEPISMEEIGKAKDKTYPECILVEGAPGVGKSTFAWKLCRKWSKGKLLQQYHLVVLLRLRDKKVREAKTVSDLFYYYNSPIQQTVVKEIQATGGRGVLLLFEGYDELPAKLRTSDSIFLEVIKGHKLPSATTLITSRPSASGPLYEECKDYIAQHVVILGFTHENIDSYLENTIGDQPPLLQGLQQYLTYYPHIRSMLYIPLNCAIVVEVYRVNKRNKSLISKTWTDLYSSLLRTLLFRYLDSHPVYQRQSWKSNSFRDLPTDVYQQLYELGRIAYEGILQDRQVIFSDLPSGFNSLGLMQCVPELYMDELAAESFNFLHLTLQEYMAALYLSEQPVEKQIELFKTYLKPLRFSSLFGVHRYRYDKSNSHLQIVLRFLAGLRKFVGYSSFSIRLLLTEPDNPLRITNDSSNKLVITLDRLHWIFETQDTSNIFEAIQMSVATVGVSGTLSSFDCFVLGYCVSHSNCPWEIDLKHCGIDDEGVEMLIRGVVEGEAKYSGYISVMSFGLNEITSAGLNQLLKVPKLLKLSKLDLSGNPLGREGAVSLLKSSAVQNLEKLILYKTGIGMEDCLALSELLSSSPTLQVIDISYNALPPEAVELIVTGLKHHSVLEELDIGGSQFNLQNCISLASVAQLPRHLHLGYCHIDEEGAIDLARLINQNTVTSLHLQGNPVRVRGTTALADTLPQNTSLRVLDVRHESIGLEGTQKLIDSLSQNSTLEILQLPQQYKSSVDTREVYRRVKDRIHWDMHNRPPPSDRHSLIRHLDTCDPPLGTSSSGWMSCGVVVDFESSTAGEEDADFSMASLARGEVTEPKEAWDHDSFKEKQAVAEQLKERGTAYFKEEKFDLALKLYDRGAKVVSDTLKEEKEALKGIRVALHLNMAACHLKLKQPNLAIKECEEVLKVDQSHVKAYFRRGQARQLLQDYDEAITDFQTVQKLEPNSKAASTHITQCRNKIKAIHDEERKRYANMFQRLAAKEKTEIPLTKEEPKPGEDEGDEEVGGKSWGPTPSHDHGST